MKSLCIVKVKTTLYVKNTQPDIGFHLHENTPNVTRRL
jgi:hypothetical protein